jgi:hypothetical protein
MRTRTLALALAISGFISATAKAEMDIAPPVTIKWNGFLQAWETYGEGANSVAKGPEYSQSGSMLKRFRIKMTAEAYDGVTVVLVPELVGPFTLLDGYVQVDLDKYLLEFSTPLSVTFGQFKTPFGLNRMYTPPQLAFVNYSGVSNAVFGSNNFWDDGLMLTYKVPKVLRLDAAVVDGQGPNLGAANAYFGTNGKQDVVGRLDLLFLDGFVFGGSIYNGEHFAAVGTGAPLYNLVGATAGSKIAGPRTITGGHIQFKTFGKGLQVDLEYINRDTERGGFAGIVSYYLVDWMQLALGYDRVEVYGLDASASTRYQAGLNWFPGGPLKVSLDQEASAAGPDQSLRPGSASKTILQGQVTF